jgi:predicted CxxxxCH...CXXCH cytochrome family protein
MFMRHKKFNRILGSLAGFCSLLLMGGLLQPGEVKAAAITCSSGLTGCHFKNNAVLDSATRNVPDGLFPGTHARHAGYSTATKRQYKFACTKCHPSTSYTNSHQSGYKNITGSSLPGASYSKGRLIPNTNNPAFGNCSQIYCHSSGRAAGMGQAQYSSSRWGGQEGCLGCHGGRSTAGPNYIPVRSVGNFTLSTTHSQHLKYPVANINCQICHSKTVSDAYTLKNYTGVQRHNNGVRDVTFTGLYYGSYTSYKSTEVGSSGNTKTCNNISCHGGKTRSAWSNTTVNTSNVCVHCHGINGTIVGTDLRAFAPGFRKQGTSTDQLVSSADFRVGSHFKHLSSVYMRNVKCNECHTVPSNVFDAGHIDSARYTSQTLTFSQSSSAAWDGTTSTKLAAFAGYTTGTSAKGATCSSVYCHGNRLKNNEAGGTYRKPYWNYSAMINYTQAATTVCARCHGYPPTANNHSASTICSDCHVNISAVDNKSIIDKTLHINRIVEAKSDCNTCHKYDVTGTNAWLNTTGTDLTHYKHLVFIKNRLSIATLTLTGQTFGTGEPAAVCGTCHTNTLSEHNNVTHQITFGAGGASPYTMGAGTGNSMSLIFGSTNPLASGTTGVNITCSNLMCHYATTPNWY